MATFVSQLLVYSLLVVLFLLYSNLADSIRVLLDTGYWWLTANILNSGYWWLLAANILILLSTVLTILEPIQYISYIIISS